MSALAAGIFTVLDQLTSGYVVGPCVMRGVTSIGSIAWILIPGFVAVMGLWCMCWLSEMVFFMEVHVMNRDPLGKGWYTRKRRTKTHIRMRRRMAKRSRRRNRGQ